jgi:hypothetical protein
VKYDAQILLKAAANRCSRKQVLENMAKELAIVIVEQVSLAVLVVHARARVSYLFVVRATVRPNGQWKGGSETRPYGFVVRKNACEFCVCDV